MQVVADERLGHDDLPRLIKGRDVGVAVPGLGQHQAFLIEDGA